MVQTFEEKIDALVAGEIEELLIEKDIFFEFREAWLNHPEKNKIYGEAGLGGKVVYRKNIEN